MRAPRPVLALVLAAGCRIYETEGDGEVRATIWAHFEPTGWWPDDFATRYSPYYDPNRFDFYLWPAGRDGDVLLFARRVTRGGPFGSIAGTAWRDEDVVGYAPTGHVGDERTSHGRAWREYRLLGGPKDSPRVAEAISKHRRGRLDRPS